MRVITGTAKGHKLNVPKVAGLRPAQDIVRQAIFSIIGCVASHHETDPGELCFELRVARRHDHARVEELAPPGILLPQSVE